jgi:hypothetical protein
MTIDPATVTDAELRAQLEAAKPAPPPVRTLDEYLAWDVPVPPTLVSPNAIVRGGLSATIGAGGVGKTTLLMGRLMRWAAGLPWLPDVDEAFHPIQPLKTLVIENEGAGGLFQQKLKTMRANSGFAEDDDILVGQNLLIWGEGGYSGIRMDDPPAVARVKLALEEWEPDILFLEPFARLWQGNENDNSEMNAILSGLEDLAGKHNCAIMLAHHRRKGEVGAGQSAQDFARGASALEGAVTYMEFLHRSKNGWMEIDATKNRYGDPIGPYYMEWQGNENGWSKHVDAVGRIIDLINERNEPLSAKQIGRADTGIGEPEHRVEAILEHGMRQKRIRYEDSLKGYMPWGDATDLREAGPAAGQGF